MLHDERALIPDEPAELQAPSVSATRSLRTWLALKESTRRESMVTGTPVLGSRPSRECLRLTVNVIPPEFLLTNGCAAVP
jgi:hypothetical protein